MNIAILASGGGSNAANIIAHFKDTPTKISLIACNKPGAGVFEIAKQNNIAPYLLTKENFNNSDAFILELEKNKIDVVVLAGFLWLVPPSLIRQFPNKIVNIHPALLPNYGGKGMYGHFVHEAVFQAKEKESGITIHLVNEEFDKGTVIFQARTSVEGCNVEEIERRVRALEIAHFPKVIENFISEK